jgi:DNA-binding transcriptional ArsR family regulator
METQSRESSADSAADLLFKALADPGRRRLLDRLRVRGGLTLNALCEGMAMSRQAVTKHLLQLEEANLVVVHWKGREKLHYLNPVPIHTLAKRWIKPFEHPRLEALWNLKKQLED